VTAKSRELAGGSPPRSRVVVVVAFGDNEAASADQTCRHEQTAENKWDNLAIHQ
jgi:hypothetical protein